MEKGVLQNLQSLFSENMKISRKHLETNWKGINIYLETTMCVPVCSIKLLMTLPCFPIILPQRLLGHIIFRGGSLQQKEYSVYSCLSLIITHHNVLQKLFLFIPTNACIFIVIFGIAYTCIAVKLYMCMSFMRDNIGKH